ncbi:MAG: aminodeoxychorismate synthase component I [Betaproteobacteria bacterium]
MAKEDCRFALFDSDDGRALLLSEYHRTLSFDGRFSLDVFFAELEAASARGEWVALAADYALGGCFETRTPQASFKRPPLRAWIFSRAQWLAAEEISVFIEQRMASLQAHERVAGVAEIKPALDADRYVEHVEQIRRWIVEGDCYQINLTFPLDFQVYGHPLALYARLRERQPVRYGAFLATPEDSVLSFSPELFFERTGRRVTTRPMKGTAPRGLTPEDDVARRSALMSSAKERAENIMIVDLLRNDLGRLAAPGQVRVDALCATEAYPTLWQMVSTVSADLPGVRLVDIFRALFPCGSITGAPKIRAMQRIAELEKEERGLYTGALGWIAPDGDCRFNVAIRTLEIQSDGRGRMGVGSGIVIDAQPYNEYAECLLKARFLTGFDPGFELIETLRLDRGECPLLSLHLQRMEASARALGFAVDKSAILASLQAECSRTPDGVHRVRLTLAHDGKFRINVAPLPDEKRAWQVIFADEVLDADNTLLRHKTTARSSYDRVLAGLPDGVFDAIFLNTRGEVSEGARSNVFIECDGVLLTPPLRCGLLPGVMRRHLLESGRAVEQVLTVDDLRDASVLCLGNALRGLIPVTLKR